MGFIKILNPEIRDYLSGEGFNYIVEHIADNRESYAFADCKELRKILAEKYLSEEIILDNMLYF